MTTIAFALAPVFLVIALGFIVCRTGIAPAESWSGLNRVAYAVLFPALLFTTIANADFDAAGVGAFVAAVVTGYGAMAVIVFALKPVLRGVSGPSFSSLVQAAVRWNGFVLLAAAPPLFGPEGAALAAIIFAPIVPLVNLISVAALSVYGDGAAPSPRGFLLRLITNPLILASLAGIAVSLAGGPPEGPIADTLDILARAALATGLLGVGAGLSFAALTASPRLLALATALKLVVMPAVLWGAAALFDLSPLATAVAVAAGATPGAAASYVLAKQLGGDAPLTAGHITATTVLAALAMPVWLWAVGWSA